MSVLERGGERRPRLGLKRKSRSREVSQTAARFHVCAQLAEWPVRPALRPVWGVLPLGMDRTALKAAADPWKRGTR
jgi:hypothetical protein